MPDRGKFTKSANNLCQLCKEECEDLLEHILLECCEGDEKLNRTRKILHGISPPATKIFVRVTKTDECCAPDASHDKYARINVYGEFNPETAAGFKSATEVMPNFAKDLADTQLSIFHALKPIFLRWQEVAGITLPCAPEDAASEFRQKMAEYFSDN